MRGVQIMELNWNLSSFLSYSIFMKCMSVQQKDIHKSVSKLENGASHTTSICDDVEGSFTAV